jgi:phenylacetate-CoA ligase
MKNWLLKIVLKLSGKDIFSEYHKLKAMEFNSLGNNLKEREKRLKKILLHSWKYVPYYRKILKKAGVVKNNKVFLENFNKIPILTKSIIKNNFEDLKSKDPGYRGRRPYLNTSGGSTGEPIKFVQDRESWTKGMAVKWLFYSFITSFPTKHIKLWGSERDILRGSYGLRGNIKNFLYNRIFLNAFKMTDTDMEKYVNVINEQKPEIVESYVQSMYELGLFIKKHNLKTHSPSGIITSAGTLDSEMKKVIEQAFKCPVFNRYGSREVGDVANSCGEGDGLHVDPWNNYLEILNDSLQLCKPGERGQIYITTLNNYSMPLIRFQIGDLATPLGIKKCSCGRGLPVIENVLGRVNSLIKTEKGTFDSTALTTSFYFHDSIRQYQLVQKAIDHVVLFVALSNKGNWVKDQKMIIEKLKKIFGNKVRIDFQIVETIRPLKNGKFQYFISELV